MNDEISTNAGHESGPGRTRTVDRCSCCGRVGHDPRGSVYPLTRGKGDFADCLFCPDCVPGHHGHPWVDRASNDSWSGLELVRQAHDAALDFLPKFLRACEWSIAHGDKADADEKRKTPERIANEVQIALAIALATARVVEAA